VKLRLLGRPLLRYLFVLLECVCVVEERRERGERAGKQSETREFVPEKDALTRSIGQWNAAAAVFRSC
jgi:hypothetical protein